MLKSKENEEVARAERRKADLESVGVLERTLVPGSNTRLIKMLNRLLDAEPHSSSHEVELFSISYYPVDPELILDPERRDKYAKEIFIDGGVVVTPEGDGRFMIAPRKRTGRRPFRVHRIDAGKFGIVYKLGVDIM